MSAGAAVKRALHHGGLLALARLARQRTSGLVLRYHAITPTPAEVVYATPSICLAVEAFRVQMRFIRRAYRVVPLGEIVDAMTKGTKLPPRAVAITFDDGYADNYTLGFPVLRDLGLPATVYVTTGTLDGGPPLWMSMCRALVLSASGDRLMVPGLEPLVLGPHADRGAAVRTLTRALVPLAPDDRADRLARAATAAGLDPAAGLAGIMLTWAQVGELARAGWTIGAHTVTHVNVALADPRIAEAEIVAARDAVAHATKSPCVHFAYTNAGGEARYYGPDVVAMLRRNDFRSAVTSAPGAVHPQSDPFLLPRVGVTPRLSPVADFAAALERQRLAA